MSCLIISQRNLGWLILLIIGCGGPKTDYSLVDLVDAYGTVKLDGGPLPSAVVTFEDPEDDSFSFALTDANGNYELQFDSVKAGVKVGPKIVRISTTRKLLGLNSKPGQENSAAAEGKLVEQVPDRYNKESELKVDVVHGQERYDFDLVSK